VLHASRWLSCRAAVLLAALFMLLGATVALGQGSPRLSGPLTDLVGAVSGSEAPIEDAIEELRDKTDSQLFVLYTDTSGGTAVEEFATQVAADNGLGVGDALYVVTTEDRTHTLWLSDSLTEQVSVESQDRILLDAEDRLVDGDLAGASIAVAEGLQETLTGGGLPILPIVVVLGLGAALVGGWFFFTRRQAGATQARRLADLGKEASSLLLATDEQIRNATQELGYVEAMYGPAEVKPYAAAVEQARGSLDAAFEIQQRLDDAEPEDAATREAMLGQVAEHARAAQTVLQEQQTRIRDLRDLERDAPALLSDLAARLDGLEARLPEADRVRASLDGHVPSDWEAVRGNRTEAAKRISAARESIVEGRAALEAKDSSRAALEVRDATQAVAEATALLDALEGAARELAAARGRLDAELQEAATDIAAARDAIDRSPSAEHEVRLAEASATLDEARRLAAAVPVDVLGALRRADMAESIADELVAGARQADEARRRQAAMLESAITTARTKVEMASGYVSTRRHGVGSTARVRAAEAERHLRAALGLAATDAQAAITEAQRASELADQAQREARVDFDDWDQRPPVPSGQGLPDMGGVILGTLLGSLLSGGGGGGSGPGWGGTPWGGSSGGGRSRAPAPRLPGLGGGGRSGGGGRARGGGGGRARGGRW
jgi:uncharacterized membrane protein YgcG